MEANSDRHVLSINKQIRNSLIFGINNFTKFLKTYSPIIGGLPLFLGALHQITSLLLIGPGYVRFFSVTQLLSDGFISLIIIIIYLLCLIILFYVVFPFLEDRFILEKNKFEPYDLYVLTVYMFLLFSVLYLKVDLSVSNIKDILDEGYPRVHSPLVPSIIIRLIFILAFIGSIGYWINWGLYIKNLFRFIVILMGLGIFLLITITIFDKGLKVFIPEDLNNLTYLNCFNEERESEIKLLYFNDKYVFLKDDSIKEGIRVIGLEKLLGLKSCE